MTGKVCSLIKHFHSLASDIPGTEGRMIQNHWSSADHVTKLDRGPAQTEVNRTQARLPETQSLEGKADKKKPLQYIITSTTRGLHRRLWKEEE